MVSRTIALVIGVALSSVVVRLAPQGKRGVATLGCGFTFIGIVCLAEHRIIQRWAGGPPLEGSLATFGSLVILAIGLYAILLAFLQKAQNHTKRDDSPQT
jgi:hypothetical protein